MIQRILHSDLQGLPLILAAGDTSNILASSLAMSGQTQVQHL